MPPGDRTRPTTDRVREALFSAIAAWAGTAAAPAEHSLVGLAVCDLYAGSGAVGLEAASRGANPVLLVERDPRTAQLAKDNAKALGLVVEVAISSVEQLLRGPPARHSILSSPIRRTSWKRLRSALNSPNLWLIAGSARTRWSWSNARAVRRT
jgi:16S rRNA G966 N2-methylase RsmD